MKGNEVQPFILPSASKNAPHKRYRVLFVAYRNSNGQHGHKEFTEGQQHNGGRPAFSNINTHAEFGNVTNSNGNGLEYTGKPWHRGTELKNSYSQHSTTNTGSERLQGQQFERTHAEGRQKSFRPTTKFFNPQNYWQNFPTQHPVCSGNDGLSSKLDGITFSKWRKEAIKAAGNSVVPQLILEIFQVIDTMIKNPLWQTQL